ncbi:MAG: hypothetical protein HYS13_23590, partial [Planctomycetia bacterium]|nr:hypothetical protein [Planctomycetia bacterium]
MSHVVQFAIPTVDRLLGRTSKENQHGIEVESGTVSICIEGADGTGKSVMALHLAAAYACKAQRKHRVVYVGTDLSLSRAKVIWKNFALDYPSFRCKDPFTHAFLKDYQSADVPNGVGPIQLQPLNPIDALPPELVDEDADQAHFVWYVDLASSTAGDDWGFVNRLVASLLPPPANAQPHLVIVDSVDGLESFAGRRDVHGHRRTRRARSAQLLRTAAGKSHLALLVEGSRFTGRTPEEFAADAVIRVGFRTEGDYSARTIQVEKVRGQMHVRGQHDFTIRAGEGSTTGTMRNPDDPPVAQPKGTNCSQRQDQIMDVFGPLFDVAQPTGDTSRPPWQSYLHVFHSVHLRSREIMEGKVPDSADRQGHGLAPIRCAGFGVRYLDDLLWHSASTPALRDGDEYGLPVDAPTALIGEDGTYKSRLARAFLGQAFHPDNTRGTSDTLSTAAVLLTTRDINESEVRSYLSWHLAENDADGVATAIVGKPDGIYKDRVLCRRLEMHQLSGSALIHIVQSVVKKAQAAIFADAVPEDRKKRAAEGWRMRLV